jgi:hypothetical protein
MQHLNRALRTVLVISISAISSILTTSLKVGRASGFGSQQRVMTSARAGRQSCGTVGRTPLFTTANAAWTAVMLAKGSMPVMSSHSTMPKLYTSTFWVYGLCCIISLKYIQLEHFKNNPIYSPIYLGLKALLLLLLYSLLPVSTLHKVFLRKRRNKIINNLRVDAHMKSCR